MAKPKSDEWQVVPTSASDIDAVARHCRHMVSRHSLLAAGVTMVPIPGVDWFTDIAVLMRLLPDINRAFGLSAEQIERLAPERKIVVYKALAAGGGMLIGKVITRGMVITVLRTVGVRLSTQQAAKYIPVAGQAAAAALTYGALKLVCEQHIRQCIAVCQQLSLDTPTRVDA